MIHANKVQKEKKKRSNVDSPIKNQLEYILVTYFIKRAAYHGGDFTGKNLITFFDKADELFPKFEKKLLASSKPNRCPDEEITQRCSKTKELCILMDYMFSLARTPSGEVDEDVIKTTKKCVRAVVKKMEGFAFIV